MKRALATKIALLMLLTAGLTATLGCDATTHGADIYLEGVSTGTMSMGGKTISGLPSQKTNVVLKLSASKVNIRTSDEETIIELSPSGASIVIGPDGISVDGVEPDQIEIEWQTTESDQ